MKEGKFQPRYQIHEYPGRKPWYVVRKYIEKYSSPGEMVLEPFCGSGVVPCEALITRRKVTALDIDPLAVFITNMTCVSPVNLAELQQAFTEVEHIAKKTIRDLYILEQNCGDCGGQLVMSSAARIPDVQKVSLKALCPGCGRTYDIVYDLQDWESRADTSIPYWYPGNVKLPDGIRGDIHYLHELYTKRNLAALSILWYSINLVSSEVYRELLKLCFSANLSKASRINVPKISGRGWTAADYHVYNIPENFIEFNAWDGFANRFRQCLEAKAQTNQLIGDFYYSGKIVSASAEDLTFIPENSVDYVLTDPPYADEIRYYERSFVRNAWLGFETRHPTREYTAMMHRSLWEIHRVLKPGRYLSILLKGTTQDFRNKFVGMTQSARLTYESTSLEHLGYGDMGDKPTDHALNFVKRS